MSNLKDWIARDVLIVGKLEASDEIYIPGCGYYQPEPGAHVIICESAEPLREIAGEEVECVGVIETLAGENTVLRELAKGLLVCQSTEADARTDCPLYDANAEHRCRKAEIMRDLGIEVDG